MYIDIDENAPTHMEDSWIPDVEYTAALRIIEILMYYAAVHHTRLDANEYAQRIRTSYPNIPRDSIAASKFIEDLFDAIDAGINEGYSAYGSEDVGTIQEIREHIYAIIVAELGTLFNDYNEGSEDTFMLQYLDTVANAFTENIYQGIYFAWDERIGDFGDDEEE